MYIYSYKSTTSKIQHMHKNFCEQFVDQMKFRRCYNCCALLIDLFDLTKTDVDFWVHIVAASSVTE